MAEREAEDDTPAGERLQKVLAAAGHGSRRDCEELISTGRVTVDRKVVTELGTRVDAANQDIRVDGEPLRKPKRQYFAVNKPPGVVTTNHDPSGRPRVIDLVPTDERVFAVGRLDRASEGLILVTNDGEFANRLTHPRYGVEKTYLVRVAGSPDEKQLAKLRKGVHLAEGLARVDSVAVKRQQGRSTDMTIVLSEGRNREIRRILARVGHKVLALKRIAVGNVKLADLPVGSCRKLTHPEVEGLLALAKQKRRKTKGKPAVGPKVRSAVEPKDERESQYVQKEALLAQPLSLEDLLRDDLDEGPLSADDFSATGAVQNRSDDDSFTGAVIDDASDFSPPPRAGRTRSQPASGQFKPRGPANRQGKSGRSHSGGQRRKDDRQRRDDRQRGDVERGDNRQRRDDRPREDFGKKRGGRKSVGPALEDRGPAGAKAGKVRFGAKRKKPRPRIEGVDNQRRGKRRSGKQGGQAQGNKRFGKPGGKRKGRR